MARAQRRPRRNSNPPSASAPADSTPQHAYKYAPAVAAFLLIAIAGVAADLLSKHYAFATLMERPQQKAELIPGCLNLRLSTNAGIVFGISWLPPWTVLVASAAAMVAVAVLFAGSSRRAWGTHAALAMILSGAVGNAYDRLFSNIRFPGEPDARVGQVRDFIDLHLGDAHWPTFNVADVLLVVGVGIILLHMFRGGRRSKS